MKLKLLLLAIETRGGKGTDSNIAINPGPSVVIDSNTQGFFIAESADDVKRSVGESESELIRMIEDVVCWKGRDKWCESIRTVERIIAMATTTSIKKQLLF